MKTRLTRLMALIAGPELTWTILGVLDHWQGRKYRRGT